MISGRDRHGARGDRPTEIADMADCAFLAISFTLVMLIEAVWMRQRGHGIFDGDAPNGAVALDERAYR